MIELLRRHAERLLIGVFAAADHSLAQREEKLPEPFLPPPRLDELEHRVAEIVDEPRVRELAIALELAHLRHDVRHGGVPHRHQVDRPPQAGHVVRQPFVHPERHAAADERSGDDIELEDVRELVNDEPVHEVRRLIHRHHHAIARGFGKRADAFLGRAGNDVLLLELAARLEEDQRNLERKIVLELGADMLVRAFSVAGDPLQVFLDFGIVVDLEMVRRVDVPLEIVVADLILAEVGDELRLRRDLRRRANRHHHGQNGYGRRNQGPAPCADAHKNSPRRGTHKPC